MKIKGKTRISDLFFSDIEKNANFADGYGNSF